VRRVGCHVRVCSAESFKRNDGNYVVACTFGTRQPEAKAIGAKEMPGDPMGYVLGLVLRIS